MDETVVGAQPGLCLLLLGLVLEMQRVFGRDGIRPKPAKGGSCGLQAASDVEAVCVLENTW